MNNLTVLVLMGTMITACDAAITTSPNTKPTCDASKLQYIVGMSAEAALAEINKQPLSVQDMSIYSGSSEKPSMLPKGKLVLEHSTPNVVDAIANGGTVTKVYCNN